jgi:cyclic-di-GMP-binding protein
VHLCVVTEPPSSAPSRSPEFGPPSPLEDRDGDPSPVFAPFRSIDLAHGCLQPPARWFSRRPRYDFAQMAIQPSFDVTSTVDLQEVDNALNQARKEVAQRYDFKGSKASIEFDAKESKLVLIADDEFKLNALWEILVTRLVRRNVPTKNLTRGNAEPAANTTVRQEVALQQGIDSEKARDIVKFIKDAKLKKVQAAIQGDQLRITSPSKNDLQEVMRLLREQDFGVALQFGNYRG